MVWVSDTVSVLTDSLKRTSPRLLQRYSPATWLTPRVLLAGGLESKTVCRDSQPVSRVMSDWLMRRLHWSRHPAVPLMHGVWGLPRPATCLSTSSWAAHSYNCPYCLLCCRVCCVTTCCAPTAALPPWASCAYWATALPPTSSAGRGLRAAGQRHAGQTCCCSWLSKVGSSEGHHHFFKHGYETCLDAALEPICLTKAN